MTGLLFRTAALCTFLISSLSCLRYSCHFGFGVLRVVCSGFRRELADLPFFPPRPCIGDPVQGRFISKG